MAYLGQQLWYACYRDDPAEALRLLDAGATRSGEAQTSGRRSSTLLSMDALLRSSCLLTAEQTRARETTTA